MQPGKKTYSWFSQDDLVNYHTSAPSCVSSPLRGALSSAGGRAGASPLGDPGASRPSLSPEGFRSLCSN